MAKQLLFDDHARSRMLAGVNKLADAVAVTMGPTGRNVIIDKSFGGPTVTKDGVTVAKEIELEDRFENMGAKLVIEVAQKTSDLAGDGTTTATVLARAIFKEGLRNIVAGSNPTAIRRGIDKAVAAASAHLISMGRPVKDKQEVANVGAISANNDPEIGPDFARIMLTFLERELDVDLDGDGWPDAMSASFRFSAVPASVLRTEPCQE